MNNQDRYQSELDFAVQIAQEAGRLTAKYFPRARNFAGSVNRKVDGSVVTNADHEAEAFLRAELEAQFPDDGILGEEDGERMGASGRRWIIDPIDGTFSFVNGVPLYAVLIALEVNTESVLGVIELPILEETLYARRGGGCFWNGAPTKVSDTARLNEAVILSTDFGTCAAHGFGAACDELVRRAKVRRTWGDAYGHALIATGRADVMLDPVMNVWDCAALLPIVEEAGGTFTDWRGERTIHSGNAISTNRTLLPDILTTISDNS